MMPIVRVWAATVLVAMLALLCACPASVGRETAGNPATDGLFGGAGQDTAIECTRDSDCVPAGPKCCDCPTHAVPRTDPAQQACANVGCGPMSCGSPMAAVCDVGRCELRCAPVACDAALACPDGFATDGNGCLTCDCAAPPGNAQCSQDADCTRVRADCCGCAMGGQDTAVPVGDAAAHDAALMCPDSPACPGTDTCPADLAPRCVQGSCALVDGPLPANACGRSDLPACAAGQFCTVNASDQATMHGVGVCQP